MGKRGGSDFYEKYIKPLFNNKYIKRYKKEKEGILDAIHCRVFSFLTLLFVSIFLGFAVISTYSFYQTCNREQDKKHKKEYVGDYNLLQRLKDLNNQLSIAEGSNSLEQVQNIKEEIDELKFRNSFGENGAKVGHYLFNELFGLGVIALFLASLIILYQFSRRIFFPGYYSLIQVIYKSLAYGVIYFGGLALWMSLLGNMLQALFQGHRPLLWGGKIGEDLSIQIDQSFGSFGLWLILIAIPIIYFFITLSIFASESERRKSKAKIIQQKKEKEKEKKQREKELEKETKEHIKALEEEAKRREAEAERERREAERREKEAREQTEDEEASEDKPNKLASIIKQVFSFLSVGKGSEGEEPIEEQDEPQTSQDQMPQVEPSPIEVKPQVDNAQEIKVENTEEDMLEDEDEEPMPLPDIVIEDTRHRPEEEDVISDRELESNQPVESEEEYLYIKPTLDLLKEHGKNNEELDKEVISRNAQRIIDVLAQFKVIVSVTNATVGPTITLYELRLADGIRIKSITNLEDDIAMGLSVDSVRIIAPLPGRGTVGVEVPNTTAQTVSMHSMMASKKFSNACRKMQLPIAIGKTITNEAFVFDLAKMPHLLVAGSTGQGKSVGLNAMITSLLYSKSPEELKLVMVDPKMLEFAVYEGISEHFLTKLPDSDKAIITDMTRVVPTLKSICDEMDIRYQKLADANVRGIVEYNHYVQENPVVDGEKQIPLPYIVVIIDEFADLMMTAGKEVEGLVCRLAQKARAAGIHLIIATQRPSTDVITGLIKANFPARIAFKVFSSIDSRTILDSVGANQLIGRGDMLFYSGKTPERVQCAFIDTPETEEIVKHIASQARPKLQIDLPEYIDENAEEKDVDLDKLDGLIREVATMIIEGGNGSTSNIQRKFNVGYNRAGRIMDQLEALGIVGPQVGSKPREILVSDTITLDEILAQYGK